MNNLEDLKNQWLSLFPDSLHEDTQKRFIRYAIELAKENGKLDTEEMGKKIKEQDRIDDYRMKYDFLRAVLKVLEEEKSEI